MSLQFFLREIYKRDHVNKCRIIKKGKKPICLFMIIILTIGNGLKFINVIKLRGVSQLSTINPIKIHGNWIDGYSLDYHSRYSEYLGVDEFGGNIYDKKRSDLGELLYELKYRGEKSNVKKIGNLIKPFLFEWNISEKIDYIIPVPPSRERNFQPVYELSREIGQIINRHVIFDFLQKSDSNQSKNLSTDQKKTIKRFYSENKKVSKKSEFINRR